MSVVPDTDVMEPPEPEAPAAPMQPKAKRAPTVQLTDEQFLSIVRDQKRLAVGLEDNYELSANREKALLYFKGQMPDLQALPNRSKAVSTDVQEAVETVLPDLVDMFTGGDDVATFQPTNEQDETAAKEETDYVVHVVMKENPGFLLFYSAIKDALLEKIGLFTWWWEDKIEEYEERFEGKSAVEYQFAMMACQKDGLDISDVSQDDIQPPAMPTYSFTVKRSTNKGRVKVGGVSPDDFSVALDTIRLQDATYCNMKSRPRVQDLIAEGYDADLVRDLPPFGGATQSEAVERARDTAGEHNNTSYAAAYEHADLRAVEVIAHYIRVDAFEDGQPTLWKVVTGNNEAVFLRKEQVNRIPFAAFTPFITPHRFHGRSLADVLMEVQRIKTALLRMLLDSGLFALNQRSEVATGPGRAGEFTVSDLLNNIPGMPIRSKDGNSVRPIQSGGLGFDAMAALEYVSTLGEQRSGVVRGVQGLTPDTLHDTASGALAMLSNAAKRIRLMGRIFAETGVKDLYLGVHATIRENATAQAKVRLNGKWTDIDPTSWGERDDMEIEVGVGSGGTQQDIAALNMLAGLIEKVIEMQGGTSGPFVMPPGLYNLLEKFQDKLKIKGAFFSDPSQAQAQPPKADPKMAAVQGKRQNDQAKLTLDQQRLQLEAQEQQREQARKDAAMSFDQKYKLMELQQTRELTLAEIDAKYEHATNSLLVKAEGDALGIGVDMLSTDAQQAHERTMAASGAQAASDLAAQQAMHDHVGKVVDAALAPPQAPAPTGSGGQVDDISGPGSGEPDLGDAM